MKNLNWKSFLALSMAFGVLASSAPYSVAPTETVSAKTVSNKLFQKGDGSSKHPYEIRSVKEFERIGKNAKTLKAHYVLKKDLDFKSKAFSNIGSMTLSDMGKNDTSRAFSGTFDGNGHTIKNVVVKQEKGEMGSGLFEVSTGVIKNLHVKNVKASSKEKDSRFTSCVVGMAYGGSVTNVTLSGKNTVSGVNCVGGIVGGLWGAKVKNCRAKGVTVTLEGSNDFSDGVIVQNDMAECGGIIVGGGFTGNVSYCDAKGTVKASGNEPVGMGGIGGCLQCMDQITGNTADVVIDAKNGHAIGGLCGYAGTGDDGDGVISSPAKVTKNHVKVDIKAKGATHVGGLIGTGLYYFGMEDRFEVSDCSVKGSITGATAPGTVAGRATGSTIKSCKTDVTVDGVKSNDIIGKTSQLYQSADQYPDGSKEAATALLKNLKGSYTPLFDTLFQEKYNDTWLKYAKSSVGEDKANEIVKMLKNSISGTKMGKEASEAYQKDPNATRFCCNFTNGVGTIEVDGDRITGYTPEGKQLFSHVYRYVKYDKTAEGMGFYEFKSEDENSGEFEYFVFAADTPQTTYHVEFRYGSSEENLYQLSTGTYAYWLGSGILKGADEDMIDNCIRLFVMENTKE